MPGTQSCDLLVQSDILMLKLCTHELERRGSSLNCGILCTVSYTVIAMMSEQSGQTTSRLHNAYTSDPLNPCPSHELDLQARSPRVSWVPP